MPTDWKNVAQALATECPSGYLRGKTTSVLERLEFIGPLRASELEFHRVYWSLHWNEPDRVLNIVNVMLSRAKGPKPQIEVRADAWGYVIATLDEWVTQARVFYL